MGDVGTGREEDNCNPTLYLYSAPCTWYPPSSLETVFRFKSLRCKAQHCRPKPPTHGRGLSGRLQAAERPSNTRKKEREGFSDVLVLALSIIFSEEGALAYSSAEKMSREGRMSLIPWNMTQLPKALMHPPESPQSS